MMSMRMVMMMMTMMMMKKKMLMITSTMTVLMGMMMVMMMMKKMLMITSTLTVLMSMMMVMMMMNIMNDGASRAQASPAIPCTSEPKSRAQARRLPPSINNQPSFFGYMHVSGQIRRIHKPEIRLYWDNIPY